MNKTLLCCCLIAAWVGASAHAQEVNADQSVARDLVLQDARRQGIDTSPEVQLALRVAQEAVLFRAWERKVLAAQPVTPAMKQAIYQDLKAMLGDREYKVLHVRLDDEAAALALVSRMKETADWAKLDPKQILAPKVKSTVSRTDWINLSAIAPEFHAQVRAMKAGEFTAQPLRSKEGWQVIGVVETRPLAMPPAERLDNELVRLAERRIIEQRLAELRQRSSTK